MNCISRQRTRIAHRLHAPHAARRLVILAAACLAACGAPASESAAGATAPGYSLSYRVSPSPELQSVDVRLNLEQPRNVLREMHFDSSQVTDVRGDGNVRSVDGRIYWQPPKKGGSLSWRVTVASRRGGGGYDALINGDWGLFRAEDIIPRAATRTLKGAVGTTRLKFELPPGWSVVTEYAAKGGTFPVDNPSRRFSQPSGWIVMGELGVRRERIAGTRVAIAAPQNQQARRLDMLALLNWTLPELARILPQLPPRLTIVSAGDPMWRGGLSAPSSLFIHASRPLISENGTSTLLHELMHVSLDADSADGHDWIIEGMAEYYSLELLRRSGTQSARRHRLALESLARWAESAKTLCGSSSVGATTALAVTILHALDIEIKATSSGKASLDDVLRRLLAAHEPWSVDLIDSVSAQLIGQKSDALHIDRLPGCRKLAPVD